MAKRYSETRFEINRNIVAHCWSEDTRYGFRHLAELRYKHELMETSKACYYNRTWESFQFESVIKALYWKAEKNGSLTKSQLKTFKKWLDNGGKREVERVNKQFKSVAMVASLGSLLGSNQTEANDWKARMLMAGLPELDMPEDWNTLSENEKETRLDKVISAMNGGLI